MEILNSRSKVSSNIPILGGGCHCNYCFLKSEALLLRNSHAGYVSFPEPPAGESSKALLTLEKAALFDRPHTPLST